MRDTLNDMSTDLFLEYKKIGADESGLDIVIQAQQKGYVALERNCEELQDTRSANKAASQDTMIKHLWEVLRSTCGWIRVSLDRMANVGVVIGPSGTGRRLCGGSASARALPILNIPATSTIPQLPEISHNCFLASS